MAKDQELLIKINGEAKLFIDELDKVNKKTRDLQKGLASAAKISAVAFTALAGAVGVTVARFSAFEKSFTNVQTLLDKSSFSTKSLKNGITDLRKGVISLGARSGESFETLNTGLFNLVSAGVSADKAISTLSVAADLAAAGATDTNTAVKALTATMTSFGNEAGSAQEIAEKFFTAQKFGVTTVGELATEFNKVAGVSKELGLSFDETLASLSSLTANGAKPTAKAATELKAALNSIVLVQGKLKNETKEVQDALKLENIESRGLVASLDLLKVATGGDIVEMQRLLGSAEALGTVLSLTGAQSELVAKQIDAMGNATERAATFQEALAVKQATTEKAMARLKVSVDAIAVTFGEALAPTINAAADALSAIAQRVAEMDKKTVGIIVSLVKFFLIMSAGIATLATVALGVIKLSALFSAFKVVMVGVKIGAKSMWASVTLGASLILGFLPEIIDGFKSLYNLFTKKDAEISIQSLDKQIKKLGESITNAKKQYGSGFMGKTTGDKKKIAEMEAQLDSLINKKKELQELETTQEQKEDEDAASAAAAKAAAKEKAKQDAINEVRQASRDLDLEFQREFNELTAEEREAFDDKEKQAFLDKLQSKDDIEKEISEQKLQREISTRNKFTKDEIKHGTDIAKSKRFFASEEIQNAKSTSSQLVGLTRSKNAQVKAIGKAASLTQIGIKTAEGAISAYSSLAGIPYVGPFLGAAAAAAVIAYGGEQASGVLSAQQGGIVPEGQGGSRDRVPALLEPGEVVIPRSIAPNFIQSVGRGPDSDNEGAGSSAEVMIGFRDDAFEIIEQKLLERTAIGVGGV